MARYRGYIIPNPSTGESAYLILFPDFPTIRIATDKILGDDIQKECERQVYDLIIRLAEEGIPVPSPQEIFKWGWFIDVTVNIKEILSRFKSYSIN